MNYPSRHTRSNKYLVKDPNLNIHFQIINGVRFWLTPPPSGYKE